MGLSAEETARDRLARAAAALAEAEGVAGVRAGGASGAGPPGVVPAHDSAPSAASAPSARSTPSARSAPMAPSVPSVSPAPSESAPPESSGGERRSRRRGGTRAGRSRRGGASATGWAAADPDDRPDWAPPPEDVETAVPEADAESVARAIVLRQLSMAPRSRSQLEKKLRQRGCEDDVSARVLDRMTELGLVDDEAYAQMLVRSRQSDKGLARRALAHELRKQGIDDEIAEEALGQVGAGDERLRAEQLVAKKLRSMRGLPPDVQTRRLAGLLARKGYSGEVSWPIIRDAVQGLPEHERD